MRMGFQMRLQAIAAVQAKVLRLNSAAVADVSPGKVGRRAGGGGGGVWLAGSATGEGAGSCCEKVEYWWCSSRSGGSHCLKSCRTRARCDACPAGWLLLFACPAAIHVSNSSCFENIPCLPQIVNMVSNDVRRLDDAATFWVFLVRGGRWGRGWGWNV